MSKLSAKIAVPAAVLTIAGGLAFAAHNSPVDARGNEDGQTNLVQRLVSKFNLNESEVRAVFDEARVERQAQMQTEFEARLDEAVASGRLTEEQKTLILAKHAEMQALHESMKDTWDDLTPEERKTQREARQAELKAWAEEHGIDLKWVMPQMGRGHGGPGMGDEGPGPAHDMSDQS